MPVSKRFLADAQLYAPPDIYEESTEENVLRDISSAGNLGALHQISFLSLYAFEMFDNLSRLAEDVGVRVTNATARTSRLVDNMVLLEDRIKRKVKTTSDENQLVRQKKQTMKFLKVRSAQHIPSALNKLTNCVQLNGLYSSCNLPPQFWKLEAVMFEDCLIRYSNPGFFFEEWLKVELLKQEENRLERKRLKKERKLAKKKRREEEALAAEQGDLNPDQVRRKGLKDQKRKKKAEKKDKAAKDEPPMSPKASAELRPTFIPTQRTTTSSLFSGGNSSYGFCTQETPSPAQHHGRPPQTRTPASATPGKKPSKPPPSKPPPTKPPPNKKPPTKPPPSRNPNKKPTSKPPANKHPPSQKPTKQQPKPTSKTTPQPIPASKPAPKVPVQSKKKDSPPDLDEPPPPDDDEDPPPPPPDDDDEDDDDLPPPDDDDDINIDDELPEDKVKVGGGHDDDDDVIEDDPPLDELDDPPPDDEKEDKDDVPDDMMDDPPEDDMLPDDDEDVEEEGGNKFVDDEKKDEDVQDEVPPEEEVRDSQMNEDEEEDEDAFDELPPPVVPVVVQPTFQPPKRKQSILMIGKDRKKMADEASANLQKLGLSGGGDEDVLNSFTGVENNKDHVPPSTEPSSDVDIHSETDSVRRKSFRNSGLNLGLDLDVSVEKSAILEEVVEETEEEYNEPTETEQWEGGEEEYDQGDSVYDQSQTHSQYYEGENENENNDNDEYYQDGYFWNGTEWVVADEVQPDATVDGGEYEYEEDPVEETKQQSSLALFGGGDMLASIRMGSSLKKTAPVVKEVSARDGMLSMIKQGGSTLKKADTSSNPLGKKPNEKPDQSDAIARLLSNRAQIAGSDSDSDSSDDSDSDDSYF